MAAPPFLHDTKSPLASDGRCDVPDTFAFLPTVEARAAEDAFGTGAPAPFESPPDDDASSSSSSSSSSSPPLDPLTTPLPPSSLSLHPKVPDHSDGTITGNKDLKMCRYRSQLEREVQKLQEQLQEEIELHVALANVVGHSTSTVLSSPCSLPDKAQELLANITALEFTVSKLEEELAFLHFSLTQERNERHIAEYHLGDLPSSSLMPTCCFSGNSWEEHISFLRASKNIQIPHSLNSGDVADSGHPPSMSVNSPSNLCGGEKGSQLSNTENGRMENKNGGLQNNVHLEQVDLIDSLNENFLIKNLWHQPNDLSEEMVRCMRNIFLCLSESSNAPSKVPSPCSPIGHLSNSSLTSFSDSSVVRPLLQSPLTDMSLCHEFLTKDRSFDPYRVHGKMNWPDIGSYSAAAEVSWMVVGKKQLEYAAEALRIFRYLVEQLAKKVSYTVGGESISAADIEYVILKMKPPAYRQQIALILALHKFKISEEHKKFSIAKPEPLSVFAMSCGMYSSPAVKIFTANRVKEELQSAFRDYVRASVGISDKGKLLVPKLLHCFAKTVVEDSLLVDWICRFLAPEQAAEVRNSTLHRKQRLLGARSFCIVPFDSRFRYLFLPDNKTSRRFF